jgi:hypothetical protein
MDYVWNLESQNTTSFPEGPFSVDIAALNRLSYAVDLAHFCGHLSRLVLHQRDCRWSDDFTSHDTIVTNADLVLYF